MKKFFAAIFTLLILSASLFACSPKKAGGFYVPFSSYAAATSAVRFRPKDGTFDSVLCEDRVSVCKNTDESKTYGVASVSTGDIVIPIQYESISADGDFFLAGSNLSDDSLFIVFYKDGTRVYGSDYPLSIEDVGGGFVKITEVDYSFVYDKTGRNVLFGSIFGKEYEYVSCENFLLAKSSKTGSYFIFNARTGECVRSIFGSTDAEPYVSYAGGNDFIVVYNYKVSDSDFYKIRIANEDGESYYDQKVFKITIGTEGAHEIDAKRFIYKLHNRYDFGLSVSERKNYPLKDGYFAESDYVITDKNEEGRMDYVLSDSSLTILKTMPKGISPLLVFRDGYCAAAVDSDKLYLFDQDLNAVLTMPNENYQSVKWSDDVIVAAKIEGGRSLYGVFDSNGKTVLPFEYTYLSEFKDGRAIGVKDGKAYIVSKDGQTIYCSDDTFPFYWDGFAVFKENGKAGIRSLFGETLIAAGYDGIGDVTRYGNDVYLTLQVGEVTDLFVLS